MENGFQEYSSKSLFYMSLHSEISGCLLPFNSVLYHTQKNSLIFRRQIYGFFSFLQKKQLFFPELINEIIKNTCFFITPYDYVIFVCTISVLLQQATPTIRRGRMGTDGYFKFRIMPLNIGLQRRYNQRNFIQ